tara:strand:+ start:247 stop:441 length:195 start_codon:yes stop_codon:yes gene_type:complete
MENNQNQIKQISKLIKKYKSQGDTEKVKQLQSIGLDLSCEDLLKRDSNKFFSHTKGEFVSYKRK